MIIEEHQLELKLCNGGVQKSGSDAKLKGVLKQQNSSTATSRKQAIHDHCKNCIYDKAEPGTWRQQTGRCQIISCALHPFRPLPISKAQK